MLEEKKNMELPTAVPTTRIRSYRTAIFIAVLALVVSLSANFFNYLFTNSVRTDIQKQKLELDKFQTNIELVTSNMRKKIDDDRLLLDAQIASSAEKFEKQRIQIESQHGRTEKIHRTMSFTKVI